MSATLSPITKPLSSRRSRRTTLVLAYGAFAAVTAVTLSAEAVGVSEILQTLLFYAVILTSFGAFVVLKRNVRGIANLPDAQLDERQLADRNRTYKAAYRSFAVVMVPAAALYIYAAVGPRALPMPSTVDQGNVLFWWVWLLAVSLPSAIMAWKEADPVEEASDE